MNFKVRRSGIAFLASAAVLAAGMLATGATSAGAATPEATPHVSLVRAAPDATDPYLYIWYLINPAGVEIGWVEWHQDPYGSAPGDALRVSDVYADGLGIEAQLLTSPGRIATTSGHNSPYTTPWKTGNLPERQTYGITFYAVANGKYTSYGSDTVES
jgi:hypothetical protein